MQIRSGLVAVVSGAFGLGLAAAAAQAFDEHDLRGSWVLTAQGSLLGSAQPLSVLGVVDFEAAGRCKLNGTISAGGLTWLTESSSCGVRLKSNGSGSLIIKLPPGPVVLSTIPLSFLVIDVNEIRAIATDDISLNGTLRKQRER